MEKNTIDSILMTEFRIDDVQTFNDLPPCEQNPDAKRQQSQKDRWQKRIRYLQLSGIRQGMAIKLPKIILQEVTLMHGGYVRYAEMNGKRQSSPEAEVTGVTNVAVKRAE